MMLRLNAAAFLLVTLSTATATTHESTNLRSSTRRQLEPTNIATANASSNGNGNDTVGPASFSDVEDYRWGGGTCEWVSAKPEERCWRSDPAKDNDSICKYCPATCEGFWTENEIRSGNCPRIRKLEELRFNKLPLFVEEGDESNYLQLDQYVNGVHAKVYPMLPEHYPFEGHPDLANLICNKTTADSVVLPEDYELHGKVASEYYDPVTQTSILTGDIAAFPGDDGYWEQLEHVVDRQLSRRNGDSAMSTNRWPDQWSDFSLEDVATAVAGEYPAYHQQTCLESFWKNGMTLNEEGKPFRSRVDFVGKQVRLAEINAWSFHAVSAVNFMLKWQVGMPRPEEVAYLISSGKLTSEKDQVPASIVEKIQSMQLQTAHEFTAYTNGGPTHPSWPAMHSAGSTLSYWLPVVAELSDDQYCEALRVDFAVSYGRTIAGVHYPQDNLVGLNIGQQMMREQLPSHLHDLYGYNPQTVQAKVDALRFDWKTFDSNACTIDTVPVGDFLRNALLVAAAATASGESTIDE